jgi:hypothetical protein
MINSKKVLGTLAILSALAMGGTAFAQTASTTGTSGSATTDTTGTTPAAPNTGAGGDAAANLAMLGASALVAAGGAVYLARSKKLTS